MKLVKNYDNFSEDYKLNENLFGQVWGAIVNYFKRYFGIHAWIYYALYLQKKGQLPAHQFELICPPAYLNKNELPQDSEISQELKDRFEKEYSKENEDEEDVAADAANAEIKEGLSADSGDYITLSHADPEMEDVNVKQLNRYPECGEGSSPLTHQQPAFKVLILARKGKMLIITIFLIGRFLFFK